MKVLILSCSTGGGHNSCASYVERELRENHIQCDFKDFYEIVNASAKEFSSKLYLSTVGKDGKVFKELYKLGELYSKTKITSPVYLVNKLHQSKLHDFVYDNKYDLVITTHLFPALTLTAINKSFRYKKNINFLFILTDYEPIPFVEETRPNYFIVQSGLEECLIKKGVNKNRILNFGIPVASRFYLTAKSIREEYKISDEEKVILVMLGSMGFGNINEILKDLLEIPNTKTIVVCGSNKALFDKLSKIKNVKLIVLGFTKNMNDLIFSSDLVLSKPGGLSSTEVATIGKPLLHLFPIPGIETYNINFFQSRGMSLKGETKEEIVSNTKKLLSNKELQDNMVKMQHEYINQNSAKDLVNFIKNNLTK